MSELGGYMGRILHIDLSTGGIDELHPPETMLRRYIGGYGLGARLVYDHMPSRADPLGAENVLGFVTGPLTGTPSVLASRYSVVAKSPLTNTWGDANSGGTFGPELKFAGFDAVLFRGVSPEPVCLVIDDGRVELRTARELWGLDAVETEEALQALYGPGLRVACIGQAGERLARISCVINDRGRAAGRSGLGAVMGAKRLKAVAVRGSQQPAVVHAARVKELRQQYVPLFKSNPEAGIMRQFGTPGYTRILLEIGRTPVMNWRGGYPDSYPNADAVDGPAVVGYEQKKYACWHCVQACGGIMGWQWEGESLTGHKPEYETLATLGTYCAIEDLAAIMTMNEICNRAGLDTISAGACIAFAMECYEQELLSADDLGGIELRWGDGAAATALLRRIVDRQGVGDLLAEGVLRASKKLGRGSETFAIHAGGQELPAHDPRHEPGFGLSYQLSPTPGRHTQGGVAALSRSPEDLAIYGLDADLAHEDPVAYRAKAYAAMNAWTNVVNAAGLCAFGADIMPPDYVPQFIAAVTGWEFDMAECLLAGERIEVMRHAFNLREGYNPLHTLIADRAMGYPPLEEGPMAGVTVDVDKLRSAYLETMDWDSSTAVPGRKRLEALDLADLVDQLHAV